jgi:hypothetical protein
LISATNHAKRPLTVTSKLKGVIPLPGMSPARTGVIEQVTLIDTTGFLADGSQPTRFSVLHGIGADPVDSGITTDSIYIIRK